MKKKSSGGFPGDVIVKAFPGILKNPDKLRLKEFRTIRREILRNAHALAGFSLGLIRSIKGLPYTRKFCSRILKTIAKKKPSRL